jgi:putative ABC transport system permease protein
MSRHYDFEDEIQNHIDLLTERLIAQGTPPEEARYAARRQFGNSVALKETYVEMGKWHWLERLAQDIRYACRALRNNPGFATIAILTAALGIGANTSIFSVVHAVLLRPLPYRDADRLVALVPVIQKQNGLGIPVPEFPYASWRDQATVFDSIACYTRRSYTITGSGGPELLRAAIVTPGFLHMMGMSPQFGRDFIPSDAAPRGGHAVLLSYSLWSRRFGRDPSIVTRQITLNGQPYAVVGILPPTFEFPNTTDVSLMVPMSEPSAQRSGAQYFYQVIARLKPGITKERAEADLDVINRRIDEKSITRAVGLHDKLVGDVRPALLILSVAVGLVLLIACVNIGNLLLARAISRQKEIAVRIALGAGRRRVLQQLLTESMLLAAAGGTAGLAIAFAGVRILRAIAPADVPHIEAAHISLAVLLFNIAVTALSGILFGIAPLRRATAIDPATRNPRHRNLESLLIVAEVAFALILLAGAGLLIRTFAGLTSIATGFRPENVVVVQLNMPNWKYRTAAKNRAFFDALLAKVRSGPGVESAAATASLPYGGFVMTGAVDVEGRDSQNTEAAVDYATEDYFQSMGIPLLDGRAFTAQDNAASESVAVVNQAFVSRFFPGERPVGKRIKVRGVTEWLRIAGVVGNVKQLGLVSEVRPEIIQPASQSESGSSAQTLVIRSAASEKVLIPWVRAQISALDKDIPPPRVIETMVAYMAELVDSQRFVMRLLSLFAGLAIALAAIGIYGVLVYSVEQRTKEIGIRVALGARRGEVMALILGRGLRLSLAGAALGVAGALLATRYLKSLLYGVTPHDPVTLAAGCAVLIAVAMAAAWLPARRAVAVDPMAALRNE